MSESPEDLIAQAIDNRTPSLDIAEGSHVGTADWLEEVTADVMSSLREGGYTISASHEGNIDGKRVRLKYTPHVSGSGSSLLILPAQNVLYRATPIDEAETS